MKNEVTITKADFTKAIRTTIQKNMENPHFSKPEFALLYTLGGSAFAGEVMKVLFKEEEEEDT